MAPPYPSYPATLPTLGCTDSPLTRSTHSDNTMLLIAAHRGTAQGFDVPGCWVQLQRPSQYPCRWHHGARGVGPAPPPGRSNPPPRPLHTGHTGHTKRLSAPLPRRGRRHRAGKGGGGCLTPAGGPAGWAPFRRRRPAPEGPPPPPNPLPLEAGRGGA